MKYLFACCIAAAVGCGAEAAAPGVLTQPLSEAATRVACGDILLAVDPVKPKRPIDYIGVYSTIRARGNELTLLGDFGDPCASAKDRGACIVRAAELLRSNDGCPADSAVCPQLVLTIQGDDVQRHDHAESLAQVLGELDTASEAVLIAQLHGLHAACDASDNADFGTLVQRTSTGWRVQSRGDQCGAHDVDQSIALNSDGTSSGFDYNLIYTPNSCSWTGG